MGPVSVSDNVKSQPYLHMLQPELAPQLLATRFLVCAQDGATQHTTPLSALV
jgi:hypothetical protein